MFGFAVVIGLVLSAQFVSHTPQPTPSQEIAVSCDTVWNAIVPEDKLWLRAAFIAEPEISSLYDLYHTVEMIDAGTQHYVYKATLREDRETARAGDEIALVVGSVSAKYKDQSYPREFVAYEHLSRLRAEKISHFIPQIHGIYQADNFFPEGFYRGEYEEARFKGRVARVVEVDLLPFSYEKLYTGPDKQEMSPRIVFEHLIGKWAISEILNCSITDYDGDVTRHYMLVDDPNYLAYHIGEKIYLFEPGLSPRQVDYDTFHIYKKEGPLEPYTRTHGLEDDSKNPVLLTFLEEVEKVGLFKAIKENLSAYEVEADDPRLQADNVTHLRVPEEYL